MATLNTVRTVRFGPFELDLDPPQLRKHGSKIKLQGQPLRLLVALVEQRDQAVSRVELQRLLWPADTFVDFENGINNAAKRLRAALNDSAENSIYIETLSGEGYRFKAPVVEQVETVAEQAQTALSPAIESSWKLPAALGALAVVGAIAGWINWRTPPPSQGEFHAVTFRRGFVSSALFGPDGHTILYSAVWDNGVRQTFMTNGVSPESRDIGFEGLSLASVSPKADLAFFQTKGTSNIGGSELSIAPMSGGIPHVVERNIMSADWSADGASMAFSRAVDGLNQLEFPSGKVLHRTAGWISGVRVFRDQVAFFEHPVRHDDGGTLMLAANGVVRPLGKFWASARGLAWHPNGEVWITASNNAAPNSLWAVGRSGKIRQLKSAAGSLRIWDISAGGQALITREERRLETAGQFEWSEAGNETPASWLDWSRAVDLSRDGDLLLFDEGGPAVAGVNVSFLKSKKGTVRLGDGVAMALSPDDRFALMLDNKDRGRLFLTPLDGGKAKELPRAGLEYQWAKFFPDGKHILGLASVPGTSLRLHRIAMETGKPVPITPAGMVRHAAISPDGRRVAILNSAGKLALYPVDGGEPEIIETPEPMGPVQWTGHGIYLQHLRRALEQSTKVSILDPGKRQFRFWREVKPQDPLGVDSVTRVLVSSGEKAFAYSYRRVLSELFTLDGLR